MNRKAAALGMHNTHYVDGTGLSSSNRSTAADLARLVDAASRYSLVRQITSTGSYGVTVPGQRVVRIRERGKTRRVSVPVQRNLAFYNTNALTRTGQWDIGVSKTGYINEAGHCLVMQARIAERKVIIVLLDSLGKMSRIGDANRIRHWLENGANGRLASRRALPPV
jgi:D-alanyl-D-alanine endopeptidase (penicillin-binding protein 7)